MKEITKSDLLNLGNVYVGETCSGAHLTVNRCIKIYVQKLA